jgi:AraC-like DNA-binding protein
MSKSHSGRGPINSTLPYQWWLDEVFAEQVYAKIRQLAREGHSIIDIAIRSGASSRTVDRYLQRERLKRDTIGA